MAIANVENGIMVTYRGVEVYHVYKNDWADQPPREYWYTLDSYGSEDGDDSFDIRDMEVYDSKLSRAENLVHMIDKGLIGTPGSLYSEETIAGEDSSAGTCPVCGAAIENYGALEIRDNSIGYPFTCKNCGVSGSEWGKIVFDGYTVP